jgi:putative oxidoreductase
MSSVRRSLRDVGLLILRLGFVSCLILGHGLQKWTLLQHNPSRFPDPLGIGHVPSILASMGAEIGAASLVGFGLFTRLAALPVVFTMFVVAVIVHINDSWPLREPSVLFGLVFLTLFLTGPGRISLDYLLRNKL